jgi:hypothetical protein
MKELNWFELAIDWIFINSMKRYNCKKGRHRWGYTLSETGIIYSDDSLVPKDKWLCLNCGKRKSLTIKK